MEDVARQHPLGGYDSGVGGLTVVHWLREILPQERIVYFGDTERVPYGGRLPEEIVAFSRQILGFLWEQGAKFVIAACNTSSAIALPVVAPEAPIPLLGMIEAGAKAALDATQNKRIGMIGTQATVKSHAYALALQQLEPSISVYEQACPELVPLIEAGHWEGNPIEHTLNKYLTPLAGHQIDTLILGCTHYPFLLSAIQQVLGQGVVVVDPAEATVWEAAHRLKELDLLSSEKSQEDRYFVSGDPRSFQASATRLGYTCQVEHVDVKKYSIGMGV